MTRVRCILVDTTVPVRIRPRIETSPVKGHFLSNCFKSDPCYARLEDLIYFLAPVVPMYVPSIAVFGVLKPSPTSLYHLRPPLPTLVLLVRLVFWLTKM